MKGNIPREMGGRSKGETKGKSGRDKERGRERGKEEGGGEIKVRNGIHWEEKGRGEGRWKGGLR